jgi:hypothetical protein
MGCVLFWRPPPSRGRNLFVQFMVDLESAYSGWKPSQDCGAQAQARYGDRSAEFLKLVSGHNRPRRLWPQPRRWRVTISLLSPPSGRCGRTADTDPSHTGRAGLFWSRIPPSCRWHDQFDARNIFEPRVPPGGCGRQERRPERSVLNGEQSMSLERAYLLQGISKPTLQRIADVATEESHTTGAFFFMRVARLTTSTSWERAAFAYAWERRVRSPTSSANPERLSDGPAWWSRKRAPHPPSAFFLSR